MERSLIFLILTLTCVYLIFDDLFGTRKVSKMVALLGLPALFDKNKSHVPDGSKELPVPFIPGNTMPNPGGGVDT